MGSPAVLQSVSMCGDYRAVLRRRRSCAQLLYQWGFMPLDAVSSLQSAFSANCPHSPRLCALWRVSPTQPSGGLLASGLPVGWAGTCGDNGSPPVPHPSCSSPPPGAHISVSLINCLDTGLCLSVCFPPGWPLIWELAVRTHHWW